MDILTKINVKLTYTICFIDIIRNPPLWWCNTENKAQYILHNTSGSFGDLFLMKIKYAQRDEFRHGAVMFMIFSVSSWFAPVSTYFLY